jgi:hypothetical protein
MKNYIISKKKSKEGNEKREVKTSNIFLSLNMKFFGPKNDRNDDSGKSCRSHCKLFVTA